LLSTGGVLLAVEVKSHVKAYVEGQAILQDTLAVKHDIYRAVKRSYPSKSHLALG